MLHDTRPRAFDPYMGKHEKRPAEGAVFYIATDKQSHETSLGTTAFTGIVTVITLIVNLIVAARVL